MTESADQTNATEQVTTENNNPTPEFTNETPPAAEPAKTESTEPQDTSSSQPLFDPNKLDLLNDVNVMLTIEIGRSEIKIRDLLSLTKGSIIELNKLAGEPVDIYANGRLISTGHIITANGKYCVKLASVKENHPKGEESNGK